MQLSYCSPLDKQLLLLSIFATLVATSLNDLIEQEEEENDLLGIRDQTNTAFYINYDGLKTGHVFVLTIRSKL